MPPDYKNYSLKELHCALESIDKSRFPERYEEIKRIISENHESTKQKYLSLSQTSAKDPSTIYISDGLSTKNKVIFVGFFIIFIFSSLHFYVSRDWQAGLVAICMILISPFSIEVLGGAFKLIRDGKNLVIEPISVVIFRKKKSVIICDIQSVFVDIETRRTPQGLPIFLHHVAIFHSDKSVERLFAAKDSDEADKVANIIHWSLNVPLSSIPNDA